MNAPSPKDVSEMQRLINAMNGLSEDYSHPAPQPVQASAPAPITYSGPSAPDAADMKRIMEAFAFAADDAQESLREEAATSPRLREAMTTRRTDDGVQIGAWEVRVKMFESAGAKRKSYDVFHAGTHDKLYDGLVIFEAAHAIVRYLNKGIPTDHAKIVEIADLEETFRRNRQDAVTFKKRYERCTELKENAAAEVFEARWQRARAQAIVANDSIKTILDNIR